MAGQIPLQELIEKTATTAETIRRLEDKGFVSSWMGDPTPERGGKARRYVKLESEGVKALPTGALAALLVGVGVGVVLTIIESNPKLRRWVPSPTGLGIEEPRASTALTRGSARMPVRRSACRASA